MAAEPADAPTLQDQGPATVQMAGQADVRTRADRPTSATATVSDVVEREFAFAPTLAPETTPHVVRGGTAAADAAVRPLGAPPWELRLTHEEPGRYLFEDKLGEGAFGEVLAVYDQHLERSVALKQLHLAPEEQRTARELRFMNEARITGKLEHPSIVPIYELGRRQSGETVYFVMRKVRGRTLRDALDAPFDERVKLLHHFVAVCDALAYAHSRGVIHRDIKPDNIMLGSYGETLVLDWGLAKVKGEHDSTSGALSEQVERVQHQSAVRTLVGSVVGTPSYMPAEQCKGQLKDIDERSDVYALGAVLYHLLTGKPPYLGETVRDTIALTVRGELIRPGSIEPRCPDELDAIACRALQLDRAKRYADAAAMVKDVRAYLEGGLVGAHRYSFRQRLLRLGRRYRWPLVAALLVSCAAVGSWIYRDHIGQLRAAQAAQARQQAQQKHDQARRRQLLAELDAIVKDTASGTSQPRWLETYAFRIVRLNEPVAEAELHERLHGALEHASIDVRRLAARALGGLPGERAVSVLSARLEEDGEKNEEVLVEVISALAVIGDPQAEEAVRKARWRAGQYSSLWNRTELAYSMIPLLPADEASMSANDWTDRGRSLSNKGDAEAAIAAYSRAIGMQPKLARAFNNRAIELARRDRFEEALRDYDTTIELEPDNLKARYNRAILKRRMEDYQGAISDYTAIIDKHTDLNKMVFRARAIAYRLLDQPHLSLDDYEQALALEPNDSRTHVGIGRSYEELDDFARATAALDRALVNNPQMTEALVFRGTVQWQAGDTESALRDLDSAILLDPVDPPARHTRAALHMTLGHPALAREDADHCLLRNCPDRDYQWQHHAARAVIVETASGAHQQALSDLERASELALRPHDQAVVALLGLNAAQQAGDRSAQQRWLGRGRPGESRWWHDRLLGVLQGSHSFEQLSEQTPHKTNRCDLLLAAGLNRERAGRMEDARVLYLRAAAVNRPAELTCIAAAQAAARLAK